MNATPFGPSGQTGAKIQKRRLPSVASIQIQF